MVGSETEKPCSELTGRAFLDMALGPRCLLCHTFHWVAMNFVCSMRFSLGIWIVPPPVPIGLLLLALLLGIARRMVVASVS